MEAGKLRHRVDIEQRAPETQDSAGQLIPAWSSVALGVPASIEPVSTREFISSQGLTGQVVAKIRMRWRDGIDESMRVVHRVYNVGGVLVRTDYYDIAGPPLQDADTGRSDMLLMCAKGPKEG